MKLEMEERDRAKRSMEMKKQGLLLLQKEDDRVGVALTVKAAPDEQRPPHEFEHKRGEQKEGEQKASSHPVNAAPFVDPSLYDDEVLHRERDLVRPDRAQRAEPCEPLQLLLPVPREIDLPEEKST